MSLYIENKKWYLPKLLIWFFLSVGIFMLYKFLAIRAINRGLFAEISSTWFYIMDLILNLVYGFLLIYLFQPKIKFSLKNRKYILVPILLLAAFLFRFFENPTANIELIRNFKEFKFFDTEYRSIYDLIFVFITLIIVVPFVEELFYRKLLLNGFSNKVSAIIISSLLFAVFHLIRELSISVFITTFLFGIVSCLIYNKSGLFFSFIFHASYNLLFFTIAYLIS